MSFLTTTLPEAGDTPQRSLQKINELLQVVPGGAFTLSSIVPNTAPSAGQILVGNAGGTAYAPKTMSGDVTLASTGAATLVGGTDPTFDGYLLTGATRIVYTAMPALAINVELPGNSYSATSNAVLTFSDATPASDKVTRLKITADGTTRTITIPSSYSFNRAASITSLVVAANTTISIVLQWTGARWEIYGDPVATTGTGSFVLATSATITSPTLVTPLLGTPGSGDLSNCTNLPPTGQTTAGRTFKIGFTADGAGAAIATGKVKGFYACPFAATIAAWTHTVDTGTPVIKVWKIAAGTAKPTAANSINTAGVGITVGTHIRSTTLTDFTTTAVATGDIFAFNIESNTGNATEMSFSLELTKLSDI